MAEAGTFSGGCHCGAVSFEAECDLTSVIACNCSICDKKGLNLAFTPAARLTLKSGADDLTEYRFNRMAIAHQFCRVCGVQPFARATGPDGTPMVAINVRCLEGVDREALTITAHDGRSS